MHDEPPAVESTLEVGRQLLAESRRLLDQLDEMVLDSPSVVSDPTVAPSA